jgi:hypothetical protein
MPETKQPHWKLGAAAIFAIVSVTLSGGAQLWGKADKSEVQSLKEAVWNKASEQEVSDLTRRVWMAETEAKLSAQRQEWLLQDLKKANEKLDFLINELITSRRKGGEPSANTGGSGSSRPGEGPAARSQPTPGNIPSTGPNPLGNQ